MARGIRTTTRVRVIERNLRGIMLPGGDVYDFFDDIGDQIARSAAVRAPAVSGTLARSIRNKGTESNGVTLTVEVGPTGAALEYAHYVIQGTSARGNVGKKPIGQALAQRGVPNGGPWFPGRPQASRPSGRVNRRPGNFNSNPPNVWFTSGSVIRGQEENNFIARAAQDVLARNGIVGTISLA
jgi:hypothetical protein